LARTESCMTMKLAIHRPHCRHARLSAPAQPRRQSSTLRLTLCTRVCSHTAIAAVTSSFFSRRARWKASSVHPSWSMKRGVTSSPMAAPRAVRCGEHPAAVVQFNGSTHKRWRRLVAQGRCTRTRVDPTRPDTRSTGFVRRTADRSADEEEVDGAVVAALHNHSWFVSPPKMRRSAHRDGRCMSH